MDNEFLKKVSEIVREDKRYAIQAYEFLMQALFYTQTKLKRQGHISGKELLEGIKEYAIEQFGLLTRTVFEQWGIHSTEDFGKIVFNLVNRGLLKKTEEDSLEDFKGVYSFKETFKAEYYKKFSEEIKRGLEYLSDDSGQKNGQKI
jgi:uncharacterized repeat protein (TIGR04138 family)